MEILIDNSRQAGARRIEIDAKRVNGYVTIHCTDVAPGIAGGDRKRIFEPFFTGRRALGGTGLGLPIAQSLLAGAKASVALVDTKRRTTFALTLPVRT